MNRIVIFRRIYTFFFIALFSVLLVAPISSAQAREAESGEYFYPQLDSGAQQVYDALLQQLQDNPTSMMDGTNPGAFSVTIDTSAGEPNMQPVLHAFTRDHPEFYWIDASALAWTSSDNGTQRTYTLDFRAADNFIYSGIDQRNLAQQYQDFNAKVDEIIAGAPQDTLQKLIYFDNWLSSHNVYNPRGLGAPNVSRCAVSGILSNNGTDMAPVCYGYATAMKVLLDKAGIPNIYVEGRAYNDRNLPDGEQHAWNVVNYNNAYYAIDPTWNDPGVTVRPSNQDCFMVGSETVTVTRDGFESYAKFSQNHLIPSDATALRLGLKYDFTLSTEKLTIPVGTGVEAILPDGTTQSGISFEDAIDLAGQHPGTTIRLWERLTLTSQITIPDNTTIDLNSQDTITTAAITIAQGPAFVIDVGSTVSIINDNATAVSAIEATLGGAIQNDGSLELGAFVQVKGGGVNPQPIRGNEPSAAPFAFINPRTTSTSVIRTQEVVEPLDCNGATAATFQSKQTVADLKKYLMATDTSHPNSILPVAPTLQVRSQPNGTVDSLDNPVYSEWFLYQTPNGLATNPQAGGADTDELVSGTYEFRLRPQGSTDTSDTAYYGYSVSYRVEVIVEKSALDTAKEIALQQLDEAYAQYDENDYDTTNWAILKQAYEDGKTAINAATNEADVTTALDNAKAAMDAVDKATVTPPDPIEQLRAQYLQDLNAVFNTLNMDDYFTEDQESLRQTYNQSLQSIQVADTEEAMQAAFDGLNDIVIATQTKAVVIQQAKNDIANTYSEADYSPENWQTIQQYASQANATLDGFLSKSASGKEVTTAVDNFKTLSSQVPTLNTELAQLRAQYQKKLDIAYQSAFQSEYMSEDRDNIVNTYNQVQSAIGSATIASEMQNHLDSFNATVSGTPTKQARINDALATVRSAYNEASYASEQWAQIQAYLQTAETAINAAVSNMRLTEAITAFKTAADKVPTLAEQQQQALAIHKAQMETNLNTAFAGYQQANYTAENWAALQQAYNEGLANIQAATTTDAVDQAYNDAVAAMQTVPTGVSGSTDSGTGDEDGTGSEGGETETSPGTGDSDNSTGNQNSTATDNQSEGKALAQTGDATRWYLCVFGALGVLGILLLVLAFRRGTKRN